MEGHDEPEAGEESAPTRAEQSAAVEDPEELKRELERLRAENEALKAAVPRTNWRGVVGTLLVVFAVVLAPLAVTGIWVQRTITDTDRWVETLGPLAADPAIQAAVSDFVVE